MGWSQVSFCVGCLLCASLACAQTTREWELSSSGKWTPVTTAPARQTPVANPTLDHVHELYLARHFDVAHDLALNWLKQNAKAPDRDRGLILLAQIYYERGDHVECFYECDELMDTCPESRLFFPALELQYRVAEEYLEGRKDKFMGLPIVPMDDTAIEMLYRIQERAPGAPIAERALRRTADYYYHESQFDMAADAYGAFIRIYPRSDEIPRMRLRQAFSNFAQFRGPRYDVTPLLDARAQFLEIQSLTPDLAREQGIQQFVDRIDEQLSAKILSDAQYYIGVDQSKAAVFLLRSLIQRYPDSRDVQTARKIMAKMPASALATPPPPASAGIMPATRPSFDVR